MDTLDRKIIGLLQGDGRMSVTDLADGLPLSLSATSERLRRLLDSGVISGFTAQVDPGAAGRTIEAIIDVRFPPGNDEQRVDWNHPMLRGVLDAFHPTGRFDLQLRVMTGDVGELDRLLQTLKDDFHAEETNTRLVLRTIDGFPRPVPLA